MQQLYMYAQVYNLFCTYLILVCSILMIIFKGNCVMVLISVGIIIDHSWESNKSIV